MYFKKYIALAALLVVFSANAAHAGVEVWAIIDNQTSSSVSSVSSGTSGTFTVAPPGSITANTAKGAATFTPGVYESGFLQYGPCTIYWDVYVDYYFIDASAEAFGTGCTATVTDKFPIDAYSAFVLVELDIT